MSEYRLIMTGAIAVCAVAVACSINPHLAQLVSTVCIVIVAAGGLSLVAFVVRFVYLATTDARDAELEPMQAAELEREVSR